MCLFLVWGSARACVYSFLKCINCSSFLFFFVWGVGVYASVLICIMVVFFIRFFSFVCVLDAFFQFQTGARRRWVSMRAASSPALVAVIMNTVELPCSVEN